MSDGVDETAVKFDHVDRKVVKLRQRRIANAEVVESDANAEPPQVLELAVDGSPVADRHALGDFEPEGVCREPAAVLLASDELDEIRFEDSQR